MFRKQRTKITYLQVIVILQKIGKKEEPTLNIYSSTTIGPYSFRRTKIRIQDKNQKCSKMTNINYVICVIHANILFVKIHFPHINGHLPD